MEGGAERNGSKGDGPERKSGTDVMRREGKRRVME